MDKKNMLVQWNGEDGYCWKAELGIVDKAPCVLVFITFWPGIWFHSLR